MFVAFFSHVKRGISAGVSSGSGVSYTLIPFLVNQERNMQARDEYEKTIQETEAAYIKASPVLLAPAYLPLYSHFLHDKLSAPSRFRARLRMHHLSTFQTQNTPSAFAGLCFYLQIIESSQTLLHVLRRESLNLAKKAGP